MATTAPENTKITYTSSNADMTAFHAAFDEALANVRADFGKTHPLYIAGRPVESAEAPIEDVSPIDRDVLIGKFQAATPDHVDQAVAAAREGFEVWRKTPWQKRVEILRRAAAEIRKRKFEFAALMALEVGKSRMEAMGDAEESADLIDYYCRQMEEANGYTREMDKITPIETNTDVLRPYGVFACISPFNFPLALPCGMSSAALVAGNALVFKPAEDCPLTALKLYEVYVAGGVPASAINFVTGFGEDMGDALTGHAGVDGVVFTGSAEVGLHIHKRLAKDFIKPALMEMGGKNACVVMDSADLDAAAEGIVKSAWGLQNQKCSACSRVYAHTSVVKELTAKIIEKTQAMKMGDPSEKDVFFGPVISKLPVQKWEKAVAAAKRDGKILFGGDKLSGGVFDKGYYLQPTIAEAPLDSEIFTTEYFAPFLAIGVVESIEQALAETNKTKYGLTSGIFSANNDEIERFFDGVQTGVSYANKRSGATTGAWPGAQPFCGWKASGSTGKGGCGPYYVAQFMREQCRTVIEEK